ncbi:MAG: protein kinase [Planctomycetaceae bacterium]|nr:protein kinase [Planctomycetaceae bacterium]
MGDFVQTLLRRGFMTNYQVERLLKGERSGFFFGDYKVLYLVGRGTFARVYRAVHRETGRVVALKVLRNKFCDDPALFLREGELGRTLRHPNIVPIYEVCSKGRNHFLVMEFVEGRNLLEFVRIRKKLDPIEATRLMIGIADGLRYAFERGLTHRDLKMSNILISSRGDAKLVDFGLAAIDDAVADDSSTDLSNTRTVDYAALERATGVRKDDTRSDVYFLGCIYYNMLTGQPPLAESDRLHRLNKQRFLDVVPIQKLDPSVPLCVSLVVNKAMSLDPNQRYQTPAAMVADLRMTARRLADESSEASGSADAAALRRYASAPADTGRSIMVVESDANVQNVFREGFKRAGYRVLVIADPDRAATRILQDPTVADCVILSAQNLGRSALEVFNALGDNPHTQSIAAILLLDESQAALKSEARAAPRRLVLSMPITLRQIRTLVTQLAPSKTPDAVNE